MCVQWSFRKTGTMGTLASQAEIGVWVQAPGRFCGSPGQWRRLHGAREARGPHFYKWLGSGAP